MNYICTPRLSSASPPPGSSVSPLYVCPFCGATCLDREVPEKLEGKATIKACFDCAIRKAIRKQRRRCG